MSILDVAEVATYLSITETGDTITLKLQPVLDAAEVALAQHIGVGPSSAPSLAPALVVETIPGGVTELVLSRRPVLSLVSVAPVANSAAGSALDLSTLTLDLRGGRIEGVSFGAAEYVVSYQTGYVLPLPADLKLAVLEMTRHLYRPQRGGGGRGQTPAADQPVGYLLPNMVASLLLHHQTVDGFA